MKNFDKVLLIIYLFVSFFVFSFNNTFAQDQKTSIEQSYLIEKYLVNHKENIVDYSKKYKFQNDTGLQSKLSKIDYFIQSLRALQNDGEKSGVNISEMLQDIKVVNEEIRILLLKEKAEYDKFLIVKKETYQELGKKLSIQLDEVYLKMYDSSDENTKNSLKALNILSKEMQYFGLKEFDTEEEMQISFLGALNSIKYHILIIKNNLK